jgi:hypothetical protein
MGYKFEIDTGGLRSSASKIDKVGKSVEQARATGAGVSAHDEAFGLLCKPVIALARLPEAQADALAALDGAGQMTDLLADGLRALATALEDLEEDLVTGIKGAGG